MPSPFRSSIVVLAMLGMAISLLSHAQDKPAKAKPQPPEPTYKDLAYGDHERHRLDFWQAESDTPTPVLVLIHGGGWLHGNKERIAGQNARQIPQYLAQGISVAAINYRYSDIAPIPAPVHDAARAIQYLRHRAADLNIDKARFAATGGSAGGCTTLWLATHDDLADPDAQDPIARESTRLAGAIAGAAQTTLIPDDIRQHVIPDAMRHAMIHRAGGYRSNQQLEADWAQAEPLYREMSPYTHISKDDPPILLSYYGKIDSEKDGIHHTKFGVYFKERADAVGAPCYLSIRSEKKLYPGAPEPMDFLLHVLKDQPLPTPAN